MPSKYPVTSKLYGGDEALFNSTTASGNIGAPGNYTITRAYYSPNTRAYELGYLNDGSSYVPPAYNGPGHSFTRAFYSPNNEIYELGWRGGYGRITILNYFKNAIALATIFVENSQAAHRNKGALANSIFIANVKRNFIIRKIAIAYQTSLIVSNYLRTKIKEVVVNSINAITSTKGFKRIRSAVANSIWYPQLSKASKHFRNAVATTINEAFEGRVRHFYRYARAQTADLIASSKIASKSVKVISTGISKTIKAISKSPRVVFTPLASLTKQFAFVRRSTANQAVLATVTKRSQHSRRSTVTVTYEIGTTRFHTFFKLAYANIVSIVSIRKNRAARITVDSINMANAAKIGKFKRLANAISINRTQEGKVGFFHRYSTTRTIGMANAFKGSRFTRKAIANRTMLTSTTKRRTTKIKIIQAGLVVANKTHQFRKLAKSLTASMASVLRVRNHIKSASVIQSVSATVTKSKGTNRRSSVTISYQIGTSRSTTFGRKVVATSIGAIKYGIGLIMNVRSKESANVQPVNEVNFYVTPAAPGISDGYTENGDQTADYNEPLYNSGEDVVPT